MNRMRQSWTRVADATPAYFPGRLQVGLGSASLESAARDGTGSRESE
jgi:hypothetical protein